MMTPSFQSNLARENLLPDFFPLMLPSAEYAFCGNISSTNLIAGNQEEETFALNWDVVSIIMQCLHYRSIVLKTSKEIVIKTSIIWRSSMDLTLISKGSIVIASEAEIISYASGSLTLKAGIDDDKGTATIKFEGHDHQIFMVGGGRVTLHYNPELNPDHQFSHKYHTSVVEAYINNIYSRGWSPVDYFMLVNNLADLQDMRLQPGGSYALSKSIHAENKDGGSNFISIRGKYGYGSFYGNFDGNGYSISGLNISGGNATGLFGFIDGDANNHCRITHFTLSDSTIKGSWWVGALAGSARYVEFADITLRNVTTEGDGRVGGFVGALGHSHVVNVTMIDTTQPTVSDKTQCFGQFAGIGNENSFDQEINQSAVIGCIV